MENRKRKTDQNRKEIKSHRINSVSVMTSKQFFLHSPFSLLSSIFYLPSSQRSKHNGQSTIEFTFAMMVTLVMMFALFMVFRWTGLDFVDRRIIHEKTLTNDELRPEQQLNPDFYKPRKIEAAFRGLNLK